MESEEKKDSSSKVLVIYTGGTIGMVRKAPENPLSPLVPGTWDDLKAAYPQLSEFNVDVKQWDPPIDSSDVTPDDWTKIAQVIEKNYHDYEGFVVLHGTDTMAYTATALSFLLENLTKPVVVTGSQLPIGEARSDAVQNLVTSIMIASPLTSNLPVVPEVCLFFHENLFRGCRVRKVSSSGYSGFDSPNYPALGEAGEKIEIHERFLRDQSNITDDHFFAHKFLDPAVASLEIFPGMDTQILKSVFGIKSLKAIVLKTFGTGNTPTSQEFGDAITYAIDKENKIIVNATQCIKGMVEAGLYEASVGLLERGVISGLDMTPEAALTKLAFLYGLGGDSDSVALDMQKDLRGEQSMSIYNLKLGDGEAKPTKSYVGQRMSDHFSGADIYSAQLRIQGVSSTDGKTGPQVAAFMNLPSADENTGHDVLQCMGVSNELDYQKGKSTLLIDATVAARRLHNPQLPISIVIVSANGAPLEWESAVFTVYEQR